jgi:hypothetical protein
MKERNRIKLNLETLFPGQKVEIAGNSITILPLNFEQLSSVSRDALAITKSLTDQGVTLKNFSEPGNILILAITLLREAPSILEEASNISIEDLNLLPPGEIVKLVSAIIDVNLQSKNDLMGNLNSLIKKLTPEVEEVAQTNQTNK